MTYKWYAVLLIFALLACIQFFQPAIEVRAVTGDLAAPDSVSAIFRQACYDCHSNETKLAWFDNISPGSWKVAKDVRNGRAALNFSEWAQLTRDRQRGVLFEAFNHIQFKSMPLREYLFFHPNARVSALQMQQLRGYLYSLMIRPAPDTAERKAWRQQFDSWIQEGTISREIRPTLNGMDFKYDYNNWPAISATVRADNGTLKMILGNSIALAAVQSGRVNPWPDGSVLAKVTWMQLSDTSGAIEPGAFRQVAFMTKDARRYRSTGGWGFSQWDKGIELIPHGRDELFPTECVNCHRPMKDNDLVFTMPVAPVMIPGPENKVIGLYANEKQHTMSTLYGNDTAIRHARSSPEASYPPGSVLTLMTWQRQEDDHWLGAEIPGKTGWMEKVRIPGVNDHRAGPVYEKYEGLPLKRVSDVTVENVQERIRLILSRRPCVLPTSRHSSTLPSAY